MKKKQTDADKIADAMKDLAAAMRQLAEKIPLAGQGGITFWHQHQWPQVRNPHYDPYVTGGAARGFDFSCDQRPTFNGNS